MSIYERDPSTGELNLLAGSGGGSGGNDKNFLGTSTTWDAMTLEQQNEYDTMDFTDENEDSGSGAIQAIVNVYGAKNLLPYPYNNTTKTENGITFTDNGDGTITASGTATSNAIFYMSTDVDNRFKMKKGSYIASGCPQNNGDFNIDVYVENTDYLDTGSGVEITIQNEESVAMVVITILSGTDLTTPITFKPMIRDARISDATYVPYAMTNKELTDMLPFVEPVKRLGLAADTSNNTLNFNVALSNGRLYQVQFKQNSIEFYYYDGTSWTQIWTK